MEDGWRDNSPSKVNQAFGKASYRADKFDLSLSTLLVQTDLVGNGLIPSEEYAQNRSGVYTSPDTTKNKLAQFQLSSSYFVNDNFTITGQVYRRDSKRKQKGADVFTDYDEEMLARRKPNPGEEYTCLFNSTNAYGVPDYYVVPVAIDPSNGSDDLFGTTFMQDYFANGKVLTAADGVTDAFGNIISYDNLINTQLDTAFAATYKANFDYWRSTSESILYNRGNPAPSPDGTAVTYPWGGRCPVQNRRYIF
jgi:hypothetical protein